MKPTVAYCTTCKGRLWQLKQTLPVNLKNLPSDCTIIILDYRCPDNLYSYLLSNFQAQLTTGQLKYYRLMTPLPGFDMAFAKHVVHMLANTDIVFNLDADNFIGSITRELQELKRGEVFYPRKVLNTATSRFGRIGFWKSDYLSLGGYRTSIRGMGNDDGDLLLRASHARFRFKQSRDVTIPIQQSDDEKIKHVTHDTQPLPTVVEVISHHTSVETVDLETHSKLSQI